MDIQSFEKLHFNLPSPIQPLEDELFVQKNIKVFMKRDDLIHPIVSGNKWRKLKDYLLIAQKDQIKGIISFGGAYSNHIFALGYVCKELMIPLHLIIRGDELTHTSNSYLTQLHDWGIHLYFISRENYQKKIIPGGLSTTNKLIIPEGGFSHEGVHSIQSLANEIIDLSFQELFVSVGTGTTLLGLAKYLPTININGVLSLSNRAEIENNASLMEVEWSNIKLFEKKFGMKYGKKNTELEEFCIHFQHKFQIAIEPIYTGTMIFKFYELVKNNYFKPETKIVLIHSGGIK